MSSDIEARRAANRAAFPAVAAIADEFKAAFGDGVKVIGGTDLATGQSFGAQPDDDSCCKGCSGSVCEHPKRETMFCGFRQRQEWMYVARRWVEQGRSLRRRS